mmetsp:Transcript_86211/g.152401  ORF Transcript_86211/g.152401 Transcript_86211/m.152401 type:complete len:211 (+) Transcript_86211:43-675(+)
MVDSATLRRFTGTLSSRTSSSKTSATLKARSSPLTCKDRFARSKIMLPTNLSGAVGSRMMGKKKDCTRGTMRPWPSGHVATMFAHSDTAELRRNRRSEQGFMKMFEKHSMIRSNILSTAWLPMSELNEKSPKKLQAAQTRSAPPRSIKQTAVSMSPRLMAFCTNSCLISGRSCRGCIDVLSRSRASRFQDVRTWGSAIFSAIARSSTISG